MSPDQLVFLLGILTDLLAAAQQTIAVQRDEIAALKAEQTLAPNVVETMAAGSEQLRGQVETPSSDPEGERCPLHGDQMLHAGGPAGPLVCPSCPNTVPA